MGAPTGGAFTVTVHTMVLDVPFAFVALTFTALVPGTAQEVVKLLKLLL